MSHWLRAGGDFYFDQQVFFRRHDHDVDVSGGTPAAHYASELQEVSGSMLAKSNSTKGTNDERRRRLMNVGILGARGIGQAFAGHMARAGGKLQQFGGPLAGQNLIKLG